MIKPISFSDLNNRYSLKNAKTETKSNAFQTESLNLSNYQIGKAIFARNNISFRSLSQPIEITDKYNKPTNGKDHLDLPNIHVYEYPDTNLRLVLNTSDKIDYPIVNMELESSTNKDYNPILSYLTENIIDNKLRNIIGRNAMFLMEDNIMTYSQIYDKKALDNIGLMNQLVFNNNFSEQELSDAKKNLVKYYNSNEYKQRNADLNSMYSENLFKTDEEFLVDINNISLDKIKYYYEQNLKNIKGTLYVTVSNETYNKNKTNLLNKLNNNIPLKFSDTYTQNNTKKIFKPNKNIKIIDGFNDYTKLSLNYKVLPESDKDIIIRDIAEILLDNKYTVFQEYYNTPLNLKECKDFDACLYDKIYIKEDKEQANEPLEEVQEFEKHIEKLCNTNLSDTIQSIKITYKENLKYDLLENKNYYLKTITKFDVESLFRIYELIDEVSEKDIKNYYNKYYINQKPVVHINNVLNTGDSND